MGGMDGLEVCGPRAAAAHGHACLLMMDCDGRVRVAASDPMTVMQSWVRGWYLCLGAAALQRRLQLQLAIGSSGSTSTSTSGSACCFVACGRLAANLRCVCRGTVHVTCSSTWRIGGSDQQSRVFGVYYKYDCDLCVCVCVNF
jgi:hypothetical protein